MKGNFFKMNVFKVRQFNVQVVCGESIYCSKRKKMKKNVFDWKKILIEFK